MVRICRVQLPMRCRVCKVRQQGAGAPGLWGRLEGRERGLRLWGGGACRVRLRHVHSDLCAGWGRRGNESGSSRATWSQSPPVPASLSPPGAGDAGPVLRGGGCEEGPGVESPSVAILPRSDPRPLSLPPQSDWFFSDKEDKGEKVSPRPGEQGGWLPGRRWAPVPAVGGLLLSGDSRSLNAPPELCMHGPRETGLGQPLSCPLPETPVEGSPAGSLCVKSAPLCPRLER